MNVGELTTLDYITTPPLVAVEKIEKTLLANNYIIVKDADEYIGIVEPSDIIKKPHKLIVDCIAVKPVLEWNEPIENAYPYVYGKMYNTLPVFKEGHFQGILSGHRVLEHYYNSHINVSGLFSEVLNTIPEGIIIYNFSDAVILHFNTNITTILGSDLVFKKVTDVFPEFDSSLFFDMDSRNTPITVQYKARHNRNTLVLTIKSTDIINQKYGLVIVREQNEDVKSSDLTSSNNDIIEILSRKKSRFLQCVSHELRTPISGIMGMADLLLKENLDDDAMQYVKMLKNAANNLFTSVNDILDFDQLEQGIFQLHPRSFNLHSFLIENNDLFELLARNKGLTYTTKFNFDCTEMILGDPLRLRQILLNLVSNAVKFTEKGSIGLKVDIIKGSDSAQKMRFIVSDTGYGISKGNISRIFEPYFQEKTTGAHNYEGYGLGLSIVNQIVKTMNGEINVESDFSRGTVFSVTLPFMKGEETVVDDSPGAIQDIQSLKVLVAEDEVINNLYISQMLKKKSLFVVSVYNGNEAINQLRENAFDLVLMDVSMPEMDGIEATKIIRDDLKSKVVILALTAHAYDDMKDLCLSAGMNDYISKPVNENTLWAKIVSFCS